MALFLKFCASYSLLVAIFLTAFILTTPEAQIIFSAKTKSRPVSPDFLFLKREPEVGENGDYNFSAFAIGENPEAIVPFPLPPTPPPSGHGSNGDQVDGSKPVVEVTSGDDDDYGMEKIAVSIRVKVSDVPQEFVNVVGRKEILADQFQNEKITVIKFLGIPYAAPPVDSLRFQRPTIRVLRSDFKAMDEPPPCPQAGVGGGVIGTESCLFLNIYMPQQETGAGSGEAGGRLPVLVWFHGESLEKANVYQNLGLFNSGSAKELNTDIFSSNKIIVVTPQYRLGTLGFLSTANEDLNGNMGLFDQLLALEWVNRFIRYFGGDHRQVTIMGHGGSAMSLGLLVTSDLARGLFHRAILMSGSPLSPMALDHTPKITFAEIAVQNSCPSFPSLRFIRCMQGKSISTLINSDFRLTDGKSLATTRTGMPVLQKEADGRFLPPIITQNPAQAFSSGNFEQVPLLIGVTSAELGRFLPCELGKPAKDIPQSVFSSYASLKEFIRGVLRRSSLADPDMVSELTTFEYFSGLDVTQRPDQAIDLLEEMMADYIYNIPALRLARHWSKYAAVYFYVFDYVPMGGAQGSVNDVGRQFASGPNQAVHGSDINFLMTGDKGSAEDKQLHSYMIEFWVNFILKGSPLNAGISWPQFRETEGGHIVFKSNLEQSKFFRNRQEYLWTTLIQELGKRQCNPKRRPSGSRNSVITFRDPEDFLKYTSALSPRSLRTVEISLNSTFEDSKESLLITT